MDPKILVNLIKAATFAALLTPFIKLMDFYFPFVGPKGIYFMACAQIVFFLWVILAWQWKQYRPDIKNPAVAAILFFLGVSFISAVFGANFSASFWSKFERMGGVLMLFHLSAFAVAVSSVFKKRDWVLLFSASAGLAAIIGVDALFDKSATSRGGGFIGNDSFLGTYLLFNAFFALYLFLSHQWRQNRRMKIFGGITLLIILFCLVFEGTQFWKSFIGGPAYNGDLLADVLRGGARAAKISFFAGLALLGVLRLAIHKNKIIKALTIGFVGIAAAVSIIFAGSLFQKGAAYHFLIDKFGDSTITSREVVWQIAWEGFLERPYLGWGPENFNLSFARHYNPCLGSEECGSDTWYDRAHNIVLDTLVETGVIGLAAYLAIFAAAIFVIWRAYYLKLADFAAAGTFTALFAAHFLQNLTVFDMVSSYLMLFMSLGFAAYFYTGEGNDKKMWPAAIEPRRVIVPLVAAAICFYFFVLGPFAAGKAVISAINLAYNSPKKAESFASALNASSLGKYQARLFFANQWLMAAQNREAIAGVTKTQGQKIFESISEELKKSIQESPLDYQSYFELGLIYNSWYSLDNSKLALAETVFKKAIEISPANPQAYLELSRTYAYGDRFDDGLAVARRAYDLYPGNIRAKTIIEDIERLKSRAGDGKTIN